MQQPRVWSRRRVHSLRPVRDPTLGSQIAHFSSWLLPGLQSDLAKDAERPVSQHDSATYELLTLGELLLISLGVL